MRAGEAALLVLMVLICMAPLLWFVGVPLDRLAASVGYWTVIFVVISWLGGRYGPEK